MRNAQSLRDAETLHGFWCQTGDSMVVDAAASVGPDFICIDTQHGIHLSRLDASLFTTMAHYGIPGLVRVEAIDLGSIGRALDLGAAGIVVPLVETASDAERAVDATRHAPKGGRSYGMQTRRVGPLEEDPYVVIQVETAGAVENIDAIAAVDGVDALYIGPADLGLGLVGSPGADVMGIFERRHENADTLQQALNRVVEAGNERGVRAGLHCGSGSGARRALAEGFLTAK